MSPSLKISAADLGTNTLKVTHATRLEDGSLTEMQHASDTVRLGFGIERSGRIEDARIEACLSFLKEQERIGHEYGSGAFIGVATEALRVASNGAELLDRIRQETSWDIEIISGDTEAHLTFVGLQDIVPEGVACAIVDIGGGSTEVVIINNGNVSLKQSLAVGSGRLADRLFETDPPGVSAEDEAILSAVTTVSDLLPATCEADFVLLAGGSGLFMNDLIRQLWGEPPFSNETLRDLANHLATAPAADTVRRIEIPEARALVLPASVAVGIAVMERLGASKAVGVPSGIRMGLIREYQK